MLQQLPASADQVASCCSMVTKNAKLPTESAPAVTAGSTDHAIANTTAPSTSGMTTLTRR
jgi:hypothetical protein